MGLQFLGGVPEEHSTLDQEFAGFDVEDLENRARSNPETCELWRVCGAAWAIVLSRHTGRSSVSWRLSEDVPYGSAVTQHIGRDMAVRATIDEDCSFSDLLRSSSVVAEGGSFLEHTEIPSILTIHAAVDAVEPLNKPYHLPWGTDLGVQLISTHRRKIRVVCRYRKQLPRSFVEKLAQHYLQLLIHVVRFNNWNTLYIHDMSMLSLQEEMELRKECLPKRSVSEIEVGSTHQLFRRQARETPANPALEGNDGTIVSYHQLDVMSDLLEEDLRAHLYHTNPHVIDTGLVRESITVVGIMLGRSTAVIFAILACWKAGVAFVLLDPAQPLVRNQHIIDICQCATVLVDSPQDLREIKGTVIYHFNVDLHRIRVSGGASTRVELSKLDLSQDLARPAWIRTTSGSTGKPKCAVHSHAALGSSIASYSGRTRASRTLLFFNPISSASGIPIWTFLTNGGCVCIPTQEEIKSDLAGSIRRYRADHLCIIPSALALISPEEVPGLRTVSLAGEATPKQLAERWSQYVALLIGYGATEMNSHALPYHDEPGGALPPAQTLPNSDYSLYVLQPGTNKLCPLFVPGEICVSTSYMSSGYIGLDKASSRVFVPHPFPGDAGHAHIYRTGDLGVRIGGGRFVVLGRVDLQFKIDGNRIQPEEVEAVIDRFPHVLKSKVIMLSQPTGRPIFTCCITCKKSYRASSSEQAPWQEFIDAAQEICRQYLPAFMIPQRWLKFEAFPMTPTSKVDTVALTKEAEAMLQTNSFHTLHNGYNEVNGGLGDKGALFLDLATKTLVGETYDGLSTVLREKIHSQSFIANGGSSLLALLLLGQLRRKGLDIEISQLYSPATLLGLALSFDEDESKDDKGETSTHPKLSMTEMVRHRIPQDTNPDLSVYETIMPSTMMQREMFLMSLVDPKPWLIYQFLDFSGIECTNSQIFEAVGLIVALKSNLRTVFSLLDVQKHPPAVETAEQAWDLMEQKPFIQAIIKPEAIPMEIPQDSETDDCELFWRQDVKKSWSFGRPLWRVCFLSRRRILAWTFHHAIIDEWVGRNISRDLHAILSAILKRDQSRPNWQEALIDACNLAARPSIEQWAIAQYGFNCFDQLSIPVIDKHLQVWKDFMAEALTTPIPDDALLPAEALPSPACLANLDNLPYGKWCQSNQVTPNALFHAVNALTIARLLKWSPVGGSNAHSKDITYYRMSGNRTTSQGAWDVENNLVSISPMRVTLDIETSVATVVQDTLKRWIATQASDPYYIDERPVADSDDPQRLRRRWGNVLLNHAVNRDEIESGVPRKAIPQAVNIKDEAFYAMVWPLGVLEMNVVETDSKAANSLELAVLSTLQRHKAQEFVDVYAAILRSVVEFEGGRKVGDILLQR